MQILACCLTVLNCCKRTSVIYTPAFAEENVLHQVEASIVNLTGRDTRRFFGRRTSEVVHFAGDLEPRELVNRSDKRSSSHKACIPTIYSDANERLKNI